MMLMAMMMVMGMVMMLMVVMSALVMVMCHYLILCNEMNSIKQEYTKANDCSKRSMKNCSHVFDQKNSLLK